MLPRYLILLSVCAHSWSSIASTESGTAQDVQQKPIVAILNSYAEFKSDGSYIFAFEGADGIYREEVGIIKYPDTENNELEVTGVYRYTDTNGDKVEVQYAADRNGFVPEGTIIPIEITKAARQNIELAVRTNVATNAA